MSAREALYAFGMSGKEHSPDNSERMTAKIEAFKTEVMHDMAEEVRNIGIHTWEGMSDIARAIRDARASAADLIDPYADDPTP